jgi:hypothetical protein
LDFPNPYLRILKQSRLLKSEGTRQVLSVGVEAEACIGDGDVGRAVATTALVIVVVSRTVRVKGMAVAVIYIVDNVGRAGGLMRDTENRVGAELEGVAAPGCWRLRMIPY